MIENIKQDLLTARKARDGATASLLTTLLSDIQMIGKNAGRETTEGEAITIVKKYSDNNALFVAKLSGDDSVTLDRINTLNRELQILSAYLPRQMAAQEIEAEMRSMTSVGVYGAKDMGRLLKEFKARFEGSYDGKTAADVAKRVLS